MKKYYIVALLQLLQITAWSQTSFDMLTFFGNNLGCDSLTVCLQICVNDDSCEDLNEILGITIISYSDNKMTEYKSISDSFSEELKRNLSLKYIPQAYHSFITYASIRSPQLCGHYSVPFRVYPRKLSRREVINVDQELLSKLSDSLYLNVFQNNYSQKTKSTDSVNRLRKYVFENCNAEVLNKSDTLILIENVNTTWDIKVESVCMFANYADSFCCALERKDQMHFIDNFKLPLAEAIVERIRKNSNRKNYEGLFEGSYLNDRDDNVLVIIRKGSSFAPIYYSKVSYDFLNE